MALRKTYYIHSGKDGILKTSSEADVVSLINKLKKSQKTAVHFHGGLVSKKNALNDAERLVPYYVGAGIHPVFMVWESGLFETILNNLHEINKEDIFKIIMKMLLKYAVGKLADMAGIKAAGGLPLPHDNQVAIEFEKRNREEIPFGNLKTSKTITELSDGERKLFENELENNTDFQDEVRAIINGAIPEKKTKTSISKGINTLHQRSSKTLMSPDVVNELVIYYEADTGAKGLFLSTPELVFRAGRILARAISRHVKKRDHGLYATLVEEVLRELYVDKIGTFIWERMKKDTLDTFQNIGERPVRAGWFFIQEVAHIIKEGHNPEISLVAHSAGSIFACNFLVHMAWAKDQGLLPADFKIKHVIFLAPACNFELFYQMLELHRKSALFEDFRMFALKDKLEAGYWEIPGVYPCSLPYLVSGLLETDSDCPLVGMERYYINEKIYQQPVVCEVRKFVNDAVDHRSTVWSDDNTRGPGLTADAMRHGEFEDTEKRTKTLESVLHILQNGW